MVIRSVPRLAALVAAALVLSACGSDADRAYSACIDKVEEGVAEVTRQAGAAAPPMVEMTRSMGKAACEGIRDACESDPKGGVCQGALAELRS